MSRGKPSTRRDFLHSGTMAAAGAITVLRPDTAFGTSANSRVQMGIVGCGGRGQTDSRNLMKTGKVEFVALADYFDFQMEKLARDYSIDPSHCFDGTDGYRQILAMDSVDAVLLTTPPYFRPQQFTEAVLAGKHAFVEKPIAVDAPGCRMFLAAGVSAEEKNLTVGAGLQSRYDEGRARVAELIHEGAIGQPLFGHSTRMGGDLWRKERPDHFSERDHQVRHWLYYQWGSGDFLVEMHVHNIDVFNWFTGMTPEQATASGGRTVRTDVGDIYDHIQVLYEYPNGFSLSHTGSQIKSGYMGSVKQIVGTKGFYDEKQGLVVDGEVIAKHGGLQGATETEMERFVSSVLGTGGYVNNSDYVTASTFTCILGRMAAYSGRTLTWDEAWNDDTAYSLPEG